MKILGRLEAHLFKKIPKKTIKTFKRASFSSLKRWAGPVFPSPCSILDWPHLMG
jgi:hypothetical protein